jgi:hypothetical protein
VKSAWWAHLVKVAHESAAAELAIGEDLKTQILLVTQDTENLAILKVLEFLTVHSAPIRLQQLFRPQEAADLVGSIFKGHGLLF